MPDLSFEGGRLRPQGVVVVVVVVGWGERYKKGGWGARTGRGKGKGKVEMAGGRVTSVCAVDLGLCRSVEKYCYRGVVEDRNSLGRAASIEF